VETHFVSINFEISLKVVNGARLVCEWKWNINNSINMYSFAARWGIRSYY